MTVKPRTTREHLSRGLLTLVSFAENRRTRTSGDAERFNTRGLWGPIRGKRFVMPRSQVGAGFIIGTYERAVVRALKRRLAPGAVFFDIGASYGFYSLIASDCVGLTGEVHAFEPMPRDFALLQHNLQLNHVTNVHPQELALSNQNGEAQYALYEYPGIGHVWRPESPLDAKMIQVKCATLIQYIEDSHAPLPDVIKLDVEGHEAEVLQGARPVLKERKTAVLVEVRPDTTGDEVQAFFDDLGYSGTVLQSKRGTADMLFEPAG